jgi:uncharacterized membrane protein
VIKLNYMDERFFAYRQRSTSIAGIVGALVALCLFEYRFVVKHVLTLMFTTSVTKIEAA